MEKLLKIKTKDGKYICGDLVTASGASTKLVIFCHGFTGNRNEHQFFNGAQFFAARGYDSFRFDFYSGEKGARHFEETSLSLHGSDIMDVIHHFQKKYEKIYLVGHSFGGTALLFADTSFVQACVFWDASYVVAENEKKDSMYKKKGGLYTVDWGVCIIIGKKFIEELFHFPDCGKLVKEMRVPVKFIGAGNANAKDSRKFYKQANSPKAITVIKGADHGFNTRAAEQELFEETLKWIKRF
jgi:dienelactone hydrolase